jgi:hypothetical protein
MPTLPNKINELEKPAPVPTDIVALLMDGPAGKQALDNSSGSEVPDPAEMFKGSEIHLSVSEDVVLVVIGSAPMSGADNTWFWVVGSVGSKPKILRWAGSDCFTVLPTRTVGYKDIQVVWSSPQEASTAVYKFDGTRYKKWRKTRRANSYK